MDDVGFIGLGRMGRPMASNLCRKGFRLTVFDINRDAVAELELLQARGASSVAEVGSPTRQASSASPRDLSQSSTFLVPLTATPSSSPVINRLIEPCGGPSARCCAAAATKAAMAPFMSQAPRP